jgi:hypothetical protein
MTLRLDAKLTPNARADSLVGTMKGTRRGIFLTTHTDGPNEVNDNGAPGVLALATHGRNARRRSAIARSSSACRPDTTPRARSAIRSAAPASVPAPAVSWVSVRTC